MSEQLFLEAFNSEPYFFQKEEKYGAMDIIYTFEDEAGHGFKFHFEKKVALGKHAYVCVLSQKTPGLKTYKRVIGKFSNPMRTVATLLAVVRDIHATRKDVHGIVMSIPEQAFGSYARLVKKIMTRELRTVLNVEDGEYTPEDFEKMGLVGIVTTVKPRNMNTVYTGPALKEYQERQAAKDGAPAAVVPDVKAPVSKDLGDVGVSLTYSSDLANLEVNGDSKHGATIKSLVKKHLSVFVNLSGIGGKFITRVDRENEQQLFVSIKSLVEELTSLGANVVQNSNVKDAIYKAKMAAAKQSDALRIAKQQPAVDPVAQVNADGVTTIKIEVTKFDKDVDTAFRANIFGRDSVEGGIALRLMRDKIKKIAGKTGQLPTMLARSIFMEGETLKARFDSDLLAEVVAMIKSLEGATLQFKGLERLEDLIPKQPVVDPVAVKDPYYFDYDHRQITLTFDNAETAERIKDQLLELGAATFNDSEFFVDKEKLTLVDGNALDVKKVQATLFPILGNPLMMNGIFADPNIRSSVRSPDGVVYVIKGNTIQVEDAPKDSAAKIVGMVIPGVSRIFDDKGNNTIELNAAGIADGHEISNFVKVLKSISINEYLSRYVLMDWDSIVRDAMDKYDLSTSSFKSLATNDGQYLINESYAGLVAEYTKTAGNVINGVVFKSTYRAPDRVTSLFSKDGYKVEHEVGGWGTQITIPLSSDYKLPAHDSLAKLIKELDNLSCFDSNRSIVEYVGGNRNFIAKFMPGDSRVGLRLPTDDAGYLAWRDYTSYATAPNFIRFDDIENLDQFQALVSKVKDFDFGANLLRNIGVSKYFADVRAGGPEAKKTYKLKDGGEVEITFEFGDKVMIAFNQASQGFDKDLSEWADEKNEIFGRISAIALYKLGTADANKTLKNIDAWLDEHIVSKEDNGKTDAKSVEKKEPAKTKAPKYLYSMNVDDYFIILTANKADIKAMMKRFEVLKSKYGAMELSLMDRDNKLAIKFNQYASPSSISAAAEYIKSDIGEPTKELPMDSVRVLQNDIVYNRYEVHAYLETLKKTSSTILVGQVEFYKGTQRDRGMAVINSDGDGKVFLSDGKSISAYRAASAQNKMELAPELRVAMKKKESGESSIINVWSMKVNLDDIVLVPGNSLTEEPKAEPKAKTVAKPAISGTLEIKADVGAFDNYSLIVRDGKLYVKRAYGQEMEQDYWRFAPKGMTYADADEFVKTEILKLYNGGAKKSEIEAKVGEWLKGRGRVVSINDERTGGAPKKNVLNPLLSALKAASSTGKEKKVTGVDLRVGRIRSYDGNTGRLGDLLFVQGGAVDEVYEALKKAGAMSLIRGFSKTGSVEIEFENVERKIKQKLIFTSSGVEGSFDRLKSAMVSINYGELIRFVSKGVRDSSPEYLANEFMDFIGAPNLRFKVGKNTLKRCLTLADDVAGLTNALKGSEILLESFETGDEMNEGIKEDLTGKAPNRVTKKALTEAMRGFNSAQFTYGNATFKTTMSECAVEIIPTSGNIRNFAKMLGARLGQELRIDDEGFLSFDLDNI